MNRYGALFFLYSSFSCASQIVLPDEQTLIERLQAKGTYCTRLAAETPINK